MPSASAADLPPELFEHILRALRPPDSFLEKEITEVDAEKREIGRCATVCKYWATQCQRKLFNTIRLSSLEDVGQLRAFVQCPISRVASYINRFIVAFTGEMYQAVPWLHLLPVLYGDGKLKRSATIELTLRGPLPLKRRGLRSVHWLLPRTTHTFSTQIHTLVLTGIHFAHLADLIHLVSELRGAAGVELYDITWTDEETSPSLFPNRTRDPPINLRSVETRRCTNNLCALWLILGLRSREDPGFNRNDYEHLLTCTKLLHKTMTSRCSSTAWVSVRPWGVYSLSRGDYRWHYVITGRGTLKGEVYFTPRITYTMRHAAPEQNTGPTVRIDFQREWHKNPLSYECDWTALDDHVSRLLPLHSNCDVGFASIEDAAYFLEAVAKPKLPQTGTNLSFSLYEDPRNDFATVLSSKSRKPITTGALMEVDVQLEPCADGAADVTALPPHPNDE